MKLAEIIARNGGKLPRLAGGATGTSAQWAQLSNLPPNSYEMNPAAWNRATERQDITLPAQSFPGLTESNAIELTRVGVLALVKLYVELKIKTSSSGTSKLLPGAPHTAIKEVVLRANGGTGIIEAQAATLRARRQAVYRNPREELESVPSSLSANTEYTLLWLVEVPVAHDMLSLIGVLLAQNPQTTLEVDVTWASDSEIFSHESSGTVEMVSGKIHPEITTFSIGQIGSGSAQKTLLPDLTAYHGLIDKRYPISGTGEFQALLTRSAGQLLRFGWRIQNGAAAEIHPAALEFAKLQYGGNRTPRYYSPIQILLDENQQNYDGLVRVGPGSPPVSEEKGLTFTYMDFEEQNPARDLFIPQQLTELLVAVGISSGTTVNSGCYLLGIQETLYPAT